MKWWLHQASMKRKWKSKTMECASSHNKPVLWFRSSPPLNAGKGTMVKSGPVWSLQERHEKNTWEPPESAGEELNAQKKKKKSRTHQDRIMGSYHCWPFKKKKKVQAPGYYYHNWRVTQPVYHASKVWRHQNMQILVSHLPSTDKRIRPTIIKPAPLQVNKAPLFVI